MSGFFEWKLDFILFLSLVGYFFVAVIAWSLSSQVNHGSRALVPEPQLDSKKFWKLLTVFVILLNLFAVVMSNRDVSADNPEPKCTGVTMHNLLLIADCGED